MDDDVLAAMARWPDVPAVYGWLSLDPRGRWRLHPRGDAALGGAGEAISNAAIPAFISRNYGADDAGRWFFQNGPQRVFVRLDVAPYILRVADDRRALVTHTGLPVRQISSWLMDDAGRLFAATDRGGGAIEDRDLAAVLDTLATLDGTPLSECLDAGSPASAEALRISCGLAPVADAPLLRVRRGDIERHLGFVAHPAPLS